jgi:hypothetical protein
MNFVRVIRARHRAPLTGFQSESLWLGESNPTTGSKLPESVSVSCVRWKVVVMNLDVSSPPTESSRNFCAFGAIGRGRRREAHAPSKLELTADGYNRKLIHRSTRRLCTGLPSSPWESSARRHWSRERNVWPITTTLGLRASSSRKRDRAG